MEEHLHTPRVFVLPASQGLIQLDELLLRRLSECGTRNTSNTMAKRYMAGRILSRAPSEVQTLFTGYFLPHYRRGCL